MTTAAEIRARLNTLAPLTPPGGVTAASLARNLAMEAQVIWARMRSEEHTSELQSQR